MFSALISFLGGSVFRMIWGEFSSWMTKKQDHAYEMDRMNLEARFEKDRFDRDMQRLKAQTDAGIKTIAAQTEAKLQEVSGEAWLDTVQAVGRPTGIKFIDTWNGMIRPLLATFAIILLGVEVWQTGWMLSDWARQLCGAILGIYVADRTMSKMGK